MNIEQDWKGLDEGQEDRDLSALLQTASLSKLPSNSPLEKLKKNLLYNMILAVVICLVYVAIILYFHIWQAQVAIGITLVFSLWALSTAFTVYRKINSSISYATPLLDELKRHHGYISAWMKTQQQVALFIYPVSAAGGFMLGGVAGSGKPVEVFMSKPLVWIALLIAIAVLVPACHYLAKWMCKQAFGKHLDALSKNIAELELEK
ncbi:MAG: hypothetical protein ABIN94_07055 [Ferruginibacter sp.]